MAQTPHGYEHLNCPFWQKPMSEVCHKCPMWVQIRGTDPNTGETVSDEWQCSFTWLPKMLLETALHTRHATASTDKVATEISKFHESMALFNTLAIAPGNRPPLLEQG